MKRQCLFVFGLLLTVVVTLTYVALAAPAAPTQSAGALDTTFDPGEGANDFVFAVAVQPNGQVLIGGQFTQTNSATHNAIARLGANGSPDTTYNASVTGTGYVGVGSIAIQSDGKAVIAGWFTHVNDTARANIARLTDTGALDTGFDPGAGVTGTDAYLNIVKLQSDGKPVIGGVFTSVGGTARNNIARLTITGTLDPTFDPGSGTNGEVATIAIQPSKGQVLIGGWFTATNGSTHNRLARVNANGGVDSAFTPDVNGPVLAIAVQPDNKIPHRRRFYDDQRRCAQSHRPAQRERNTRYRVQS